MPADITTITSLITAFRTESREEAVTTEVLGALLQKIANVIATPPSKRTLTPSPHGARSSANSPQSSQT